MKNLLAFLTLMLTLSPLSNFLTFEFNIAKGADQNIAENEEEGEDIEEDGSEGDDLEEDSGDSAPKAPEGQATNGKEEPKKEQSEMPKPENPPSEEPMPKPSDLAAPVEPELTKPEPPPAPPRGSLKAKKPKKPVKEKAKGKEKAKPKKEKVKDKPKSKPAKDKPKNGKGMKTVNSNCNIRAKADKDAKKLGMLEPGQKIKADPSGKKWFKIIHKGKSAYVNAVCFK